MLYWDFRDVAVNFTDRVTLIPDIVCDFEL